MSRSPSTDSLLLSDEIVQAHWIASMPIRRGNKIPVSFSRKRKEAYHPSSTSDETDAPGPLRRLVKRLRGDVQSTEDAVSEKHKSVRSGVVWSILAKRRKSIRNGGGTTDEHGHRILSWLREAPTGVSTQTSHWSEQTYTASLDNSTVPPWSPDGSSGCLKAFAQTHAPVHGIVLAHEVDATGLIELEDTSPRAEFPDRPTTPVKLVNQYAQSGRLRCEELVSPDRTCVEVEETIAFQRRGSPPARSRPIRSSLHPAKTIPSDHTYPWSPVSLTQGSDGTRTATEDDNDEAHLSPNSVRPKVLRTGICEDEDPLVPDSAKRDLRSHNGVGTCIYPLNAMAIRLVPGGIPLGEPESNNRLPDVASGAKGAARLLDHVERPDACDGASEVIADGIRPMDSCSFMAGDDILDHHKSRQKTYHAPDIVRTGSLESVEESEENSSVESSSIWLSEVSDDIPNLKSAHPFLSEVLDKLEGWQRCPAGADSQVNGTSATAGSSPLSSSGGDPPRKRQRKRSQSGNRHDQGQLPEEHGVTTKRRRTAARKVTFACPYSKKEPMKHRDCYKYMLTRIRDVKQHLSRCHRMPMYCPRCFATFGTEDSRDDHIVRVECMPARSAAKPDGITEAQRQQLSHKSPANLSREDQWFGVWDILFPGTPRPASPYIDSELLQDITLYQDFLTTSGPQILSDVLAQRGAAITWSTTNGERDSATSQQSILEEGLRLVFDEWAGRNGMSRQPSTATSSSSGSASRLAPPSLGSATTNEPQPPRQSLMVPQTGHVTPNELHSNDIPGLRCDRLRQTDPLTPAGPERPRAPEIIPDLMRQSNYTTVGQPIHCIQRATHGISPQTGTGILDGPYVPGLTFRVEEHPQFVGPDLVHGELVDFENDDLLIHVGDDVGAVTSSGGRPSTYLPSFLPPELDFRADVG